MPSITNGIPASCAILATASISVKSNEGFEIVSMNINLVLSVIAFAKLLGSLASTNFVLIPNLGSIAPN